jgi:hypothetical protein
MDDAYVYALESQLREWERMYAELKGENEELRKEIDLCRELRKESPPADPGNGGASGSDKLRHV